MPETTESDFLGRILFTYARFSYIEDNNLLFLVLKKGDRELQMCVDTGNSNTVVDLGVYQEVTGKAGDELPVMGTAQAAGGDMPLRLGSLTGLSAVTASGEVSRFDFSMVGILDLSALNGMMPPGTRRLDGALGNDFLESCKIDFVNKAIYRRNDGDQEKAALVDALASRGFTAVPMQKIGAGVFRVIAEINGRSVNCSFDSGAGESAMDLETAQALGVRMREAEPAMGADGVPMKSFSATLDGLAVGGLAVNPYPVGVRTYGKSVLELYRTKQSSLVIWLGRDFLVRHRAIADMENQALHLKKQQ